MVKITRKGTADFAQRLSQNTGRPMVTLQGSTMS